MIAYSTYSVTAVGKAYYRVVKKTGIYYLFLFIYEEIILL